MLLPHGDRLWAPQRHPGRRAKNTSSRPGRSEAPRTSSTANPLATNATSTSSRARKHNVESDVNTFRSEANTHVQRYLTNVPLTSTTSTQLSTAPTPWISVVLEDSARFHPSHAR